MKPPFSSSNYSLAASAVKQQAAAQLDRNGPLALLKRLPDGEEVAAARNMPKMVVETKPREGFLLKFMNIYIPDAPCVEYLPTFGPFLG